MSNISILSKVNSLDICLEPYPHIFIEDVLDEEVYEELIGSLPVIPRYKNNNKRINMSTRIIAGNKKTGACLKAFMSYHVSKEFWLEFLFIFKESILSIYPNLERQYKKSMNDFNLSVLSNKSKSYDAGLECFFGLNTPVKKVSSVRGPHVDNQSALYAGLFYMRDNKDDSTGGDLNIYVYKNPNENKIFYPKTEVYEDRVKSIKTIPYKKNTLIFFINSDRSVHGVTPRSVTTHPRLFMNFVCRMHNPLFKVVHA